MTSSHQSWGLIPNADHKKVLPVSWQDEINFTKLDGSVLPYGLGRSYGDSCLNDGQNLIDVAGLNRLMAFDEHTGVLRCEAGVTFEQILTVFVPRGWFLPVTPGTKFVTVGGAIANDVHGKNHHVAGTFGCFVLTFELLRSDGSRLVCSPSENTDFFNATIGGLGLTGIILWADVKLKHITSAFIEQEVIKYKTLDEFFKLSEESASTHEYTVAWIDCTAKGAELGRGHFMRGDHSRDTSLGLSSVHKTRLSVPFFMPEFVLNQTTVKIFNFLYYQRQQSECVTSTVFYDGYFYPLDSVLHWNRIYGRRGFYQYQFVIPLEQGPTRIVGILEAIAQSGLASFLAVLKIFGNISSPGLMSFPAPGVTLALDFANAGEDTLQLFEKLDAMVAEAGGRVYPAKDARLSALHFKHFFPQWSKFTKYIDPRFSSGFWRRVTQVEG